MGARRPWTASMISALSNALQVDRGDAEVAVAQLTLDDDQRHAFVSHLDGVGVSELIGRERRRTPALAEARRSSARAAAGDDGRPRVGPLITQNSGPTGSSTRRSIQGCRCS